jgi:hypothetical protein
MAARRPDGGVLAFLLACAAASLLHHVHNAEFLQDYPNRPASLSRWGADSMEFLRVFLVDPSTVRNNEMRRLDGLPVSAARRTS